VILGDVEHRLAAHQPNGSMIVTESHSQQRPIRTCVPSVNDTVRHSPRSVSIERSSQATFAMKPRKKDTVRHATAAAIFQPWKRKRGESSSSASNGGGSGGVGSRRASRSMTLVVPWLEPPGERLTTLAARSAW
jgi:hypothetical protein